MKKMVSIMLAAAMVFALAMPAFADSITDFSNPIKVDVNCGFGEEVVFGGKVYHVVIDYNVTDGAINDATKVEWDASLDPSVLGYHDNHVATGTKIVHNPTNSFAMTNYSNDGVRYNLSFEFTQEYSGNLGYDLEYYKLQNNITDDFISSKEVTGSIASAENPNFKSDKYNTDYWAGEAHSATASIQFKMDKYVDAILRYFEYPSADSSHKLGTLTLKLTPGLPLS